jgi:Zn-dependent protease with chaperone function
LLASASSRLISLRASQRAEYLADAIGARAASPASMASALDVIVTGRDTYKTVIEQREGRKSHPLSGESNPVFWDGLRSSLAAVPESELERRRRVARHALVTVANTHPPAHLRISRLSGLSGVASVSLSAAQEDKIRAELARDYARIGH